MAILPNYTILEEIHQNIYQNNKIRTFRGYMTVNQTPVMIKILMKEAFNLFDVSRLINEYEITQSLDIDGIIKPMALERTDSYFALITKDIGVVPLKTYIGSHTVDPMLFMDIAVQLAETIGRIHERGIIHNDLKPEHINIHPDTGKVYLSGFSNASNISSENKNNLPSMGMECSPEYISPEQTGLLNTVIDQRSDLYSLGVIFYEMLTGRLPLEAGSHQEWLHAHITVKPKPPINIKPDIPSVISEIVMKLLEKNMEERYQNAFGLAWDIRECKKRWMETGKIDTFTIRRRDVYTYFQLPHKLYGRDVEAEILKSAFDRVSKGSTEIVFVSGYPGIGKTALVNQVLKPLVLGKGYFISGKLDQLKKNIPYAPLMDAFGSLIKQLMTEDEKKLKQWRNTILDVLGKNAAVMTEIIPELETLIGKQPPVDELPPMEAENRFSMVFREFVSIFARKEHPLVVFLDDLQWAGMACIGLVNYLIYEANLHSLLFIGAYRDNEVGGSSPLTRIIEGMGEYKANKTHISLMPLDWEQTLRLVADTLHTDPECVARLTEVLYRESGGNPFFLRQLLMLIHKKGYLYFDVQHGRWKWKIEEIQKIEPGNDVLQFFMKKLQGMTKETLEIMKLASCIGSRFDLQTLSDIWGKSVEETASGLMPSFHEGLVLPVTNPNEDLPTEYIQDIHTEPSVYKFLHDRVQQAVYSLIDGKEKKEKHLAIGRYLLKETTEDNLDEIILSVMDHFNRSLELVDDPEERLQLARYNLLAGRKAKALAAYTSALQYFRFGSTLLTDGSWQRDYKLCYDLHLERAQAEYLSGNVNVAEELFDTVIQKVDLEIERAGIYGLKVILYASVGKYDEAVNTGIAALRNLGVRIPVHPTKMDYARELLFYKWNMRNKKIDDLMDLPEMEDHKQRKVAELLSRLCSVTMTSNPDLYSYIIIKTGNHACRYGNSYMSPVGFFGYCFTEGIILGNYGLSDRYAKVCIHLAEKYGNSPCKCIIYFVIGAFVVHWTRHLSLALEYMKKAIVYGKEAGDMLYIGYAHCLILETSYLMGNPLVRLAEMAREKHDIAKQLQHDNLTINVAIYQKVISILQGSDINSLETGISDFEDKEFLALVQGDGTSLATYYFNKMYLCYMAGSHMEALSAAQNVELLADTIQGFMISAEYKFYYSLVIAAIYEGRSPSYRKGLWRILKKNQRQMKKCSEACKENFLHKYLLVEAEMARLQHRDSDAMLLYNQAVESAQENGYIQWEALANELAAKFYLSCGMIKIAMTYMRDACRAYSKWGAQAKIRQLQEQYPELVDPLSLYTPKNDNEALLEDLFSMSAPDSNASEGLDTYLLSEVMESISKETDIDKLLVNVLKISAQCIGADKGYFILNKGGRMFIKAIKDSNSSIAVTRSIPLEQSHMLSKAVVRYVARTQETVVLNCREQVGIFATDPYIMESNPKSIASLPLLFQGSVVGVLYFENSFIPGVFTPERLEALKWLSVQMAYVDNIQSYLGKAEVLDKPEASVYLIDPLTEREMEVLMLIAEGMSNKEIADHLDITINTVKGYIKNIYQKLGVHRRVQVITKARELNLIRDI